MLLLVNHHRTLAVDVFIVALLTNWLDGHLARTRPHMATNRGRDLFQPVCDLVLAATTVTGLVWSGAWPWWVGVALLAVAGALQLISRFADANDFMRRLKRHQYYIHPLFSIIVMVVACERYLALSVSTYEPVFQFLLFFIFNFGLSLVVYERRSWLAKLLAGPPAKPQSD